MKINITEKNMDKLQNLLDCLQKRMTSRTITAKDILEATEDIERRLDIPKARMTGITAVVDMNAQDFPRAYKYTPQSTLFALTKTETGWAVTDIWRDECHRSNRGFTLSLTDEAKKAIIDRISIF